MKKKVLAVLLSTAMDASLQLDADQIQNQMTANLIQRQRQKPTQKKRQKTLSR